MQRVRVNQERALRREKGVGRSIATVWGISQRGGAREKRHYGGTYPGEKRFVCSTLDAQDVKKSLLARVGRYRYLKGHYILRMRCYQISPRVKGVRKLKRVICSRSYSR